MFFMGISLRNGHNSITPFPYDLPRRQGIAAGDPLEQSDDLRVARKLADRLLMYLRHQRSRTIARELFELFVKLGILKALPYRLLKNIYPIFGCARRQNIG